MNTTETTAVARPEHQVILASQSPIRAKLLTNAGLEISTVPARIDEATVKTSMLAEGHKPRNIADALAEMKAQKIAGKFPGKLVIGTDQVLVCDGVLFDKPTSITEAREQLLQLRNRSHELLSAAVIFEGSDVVFRHIGKVRLVMRGFSAAFLDDYLHQEKENVMDTVGGYKIEERGAQLFSRIDGDYFSILGLPLIEILEYLRNRGILIR